MSKYFVFEAIDGGWDECETLEEARKIARDYFDFYSDDGIPEEYINGGIKIMQVFEESYCPVIKKRSDSRGPWPYDFDELLGFEMRPVDFKDTEPETR